MKIPKLLKITSRTSSITNAFIQAIIPTIPWSEEEQQEALSKLSMSKSDMKCVYCGSKTTDWDHLRPLVRNKKPTGYLHEIRNLVPACGPCNQSKGGQDWDRWFHSKTANSPTKRKIEDLETKYNNINNFFKWGNLSPIENLVNNTELQKYWKIHDEIITAMQSAQKEAEIIKSKLQVMSTKP